MVLLHVGQTCDRFGVVHERVELGEIDHGQQDLERDVFVAPGAPRSCAATSSPRCADSIR